MKLFVNGLQVRISKVIIFSSVFVSNLLSNAVVIFSDVFIRKGVHWCGI